ncbi:MAG: metal-dependent transcriptional regulator [Spirochaetota bacterium]
MSLSQSTEDYLEAVYLLENEGTPTVTALSERLKVKKPSVVHALNTLSARRYIDKEHYGRVTLTASGRRAAKAIFDRHVLIKNFLTSVLGISEANADKDACAMEHVLTPEALKKIAAYTKGQQ